MASYKIEQTRELLLKVWTVLLLGFYGVGFLHEKMLVEQAEALKADVLPDVAKLLFFALMFVAFLIDVVEMREDKEKAEILNSLDKSGDKLSIKGFRYSDLVQQVDMVYADSSNLRIPIVEAYRYILKKLRGASPETLANEIAKLRKSYNI